MMSTKQTSTSIIGLIVLLAALLVSCGGAAEEEAEPAPRPDPKPLTETDPTAPEEEVVPHGGLVPKPIQIGPKGGGGTLEFHEDGDTITPTGGSSIRGDLAGGIDKFVGKFATVATPEQLGQLRFTFKDGMIGSVQKYSDVVIRVNYSGSLEWELNGEPIPTCDPCDAVCAEEIFPSVMLNEMDGPILAKRNGDTSWLAIDYLSLKMQSAPECPE